MNAPLFCFLHYCSFCYIFNPYKNTCESLEANLKLNNIVHPRFRPNSLVGRSKNIFLHFVLFILETGNIILNYRNCKTKMSRNYSGGFFAKGNHLRFHFTPKYFFSMISWTSTLADMGFAMQNLYWPVYQMTEGKYFNPENVQWLMSSLYCTDFYTVAQRHSRAMERLRYQ